MKLEDSSFLIETPKKKMFASLIVQLPSEYEGGQLIVRHQGRKLVFDFAKDSQFNYHFMAFYADCLHEVKKVTRGYRLCLVYNIIHVGKGLPPYPNGSGAIISSIVQIMKAWNDNLEPSKLVYVLEHQYTHASLSFANLKGKDQSVAQVLKRAKELYDFDLYLGMISIFESGYPTDYDRYTGYKGVSLDVTESQHHIDAWMINVDDHKEDLGQMKLDKEEELIPEDGLDELDDPEKEEVNEATGNEGATVDRWYCKAALVMWPRSAEFANIFDFGIENAVDRLEKLIKEFQMGGAVKEGKLWLQVEGLAADIICHMIHDNASNVTSSISKFVSALLIIGESKLAEMFISNTRSTNFGKDIVRLCEKFGWKALQREIKLLFQRNSNQLGGCIEMLCSLIGCANGERLAHGERYDVCADLMKILSNQLGSIFDYRQKRHASIIVNFFRCLYSLSLADIMDSVSQYIIAHSNIDVDNDIVPAVKTLNTWSNRFKDMQPFVALVKHCIESLQKRPQPVAPTDWSINATLSWCKCANCVDVIAFLRHPTRTEWSLRANQQIRSHVESTVRGYYDVHCHTVATGSPHTLVVTKNRRSYKDKLNKYQKDQETIAELKSMLNVTATQQPPSKKQKFQQEVIVIE